MLFLTVSILHIQILKFHAKVVTTVKQTLPNSSQNPTYFKKHLIIKFHEILSITSWAKINNKFKLHAYKNFQKGAHMCL